VALGLFTILPLGTTQAIGRAQATRAIRWLPLTGLIVALPAAGVLLAVRAAGHGGERAALNSLLASVLAVAALAVLTGGLHLDGLADTADGLGSRRPAAGALEIMRRSDIGPFGVTALVLVLLMQVAALAAITQAGRAAAALVAAAVTGRVAVVLATGPSSPAARPDGLGALVAAATSGAARASVAAALLVAATAGAAAVGGLPFAWRAAAAVAAGLLAAGLLRRAALRRLGGLTGDVYGALVETGATTVLLVLALTA
jgi:adenosylcobinamide-GDP ribazoletransferase